MSNYLVYRESHTDKVVVDAVVTANAVTKRVTGPVMFVYRGTKYKVTDVSPLPAAVAAALGLP